MNLENVAPRLSHPTYVAPTAHIAGDVSLGAGVSVWPGAVVRGDASAVAVGARSAIRERAVVAVVRQGVPTRSGDGGGTGPEGGVDGVATRIGSDVMVGCGATVHAATLKDGAVVGAGAVVGGGAVVGEKAVVGAGTLGEREGMWTGSLSRRSIRGSGMECACLWAAPGAAGRWDTMDTVVRGLWSVRGVTDPRPAWWSCLFSSTDDRLTVDDRASRWVTVASLGSHPRRPVTSLRSSNQALSLPPAPLCHPPPCTPVPPPFACGRCPTKSCLRRRRRWRSLAGCRWCTPPWECRQTWQPRWACRLPRPPRRPLRKRLFPPSPPSCSFLGFHSCLVLRFFGFFCCSSCSCSCWQVVQAATLPFRPCLGPRGGSMALVWSPFQARRWPPLPGPRQEDEPTDLDPSLPIPVMTPPQPPYGGGCTHTNSSTYPSSGAAQPATQV